MLGGGLEVGRVFARVGAVFEDEGFARWERTFRGVKEQSHQNVDAHLGAKVDGRGFDEYGHKLHAVDEGHKRLGSSSVRVAGYLGNGVRLAGYGAAAGVGAAALGVKELLTQFAYSEKVGAQTVAVLKSTHQEAGLTAKQIGALATKVSEYSGIDDEAVQSGENLLLTFTNIRNEAGRGNDIFTQSTKIMADMSTALGQDMKSSAIQLGKALNDPIKGVTALQRVGVSFDAGQKAQIKTLVEHGKRMEAQKLILRELNKEFGGSAKAAGDTFSGSINKAKTAIGNLAEAAGGYLAPMVKKAADFITGLARSITDAGDPATTLGSKLKGVGQIIGDVFAWVKKAIEDVANDPGVQRFVETAGRYLGDLARNVGQLVTYIIRQVKSVAPELKTIGEAILAVVGVVLKVVDKMLPSIRKALEGVVDIVRGIIKVLAGLLTLDFAKVWDGLKDIVGGALKAVVNVLVGGTKPIRMAFSAIFDGLGALARGAWDVVTGIVKKGLDFLLGGVTTVLGIIADAARAASHLPFIGGQFKGVADQIDGAKDSIDKFRESLRETEPHYPKMTQGLSDAGGRVADLKDRLKTLKRGTDEYRVTARALRGAQQDLNNELAKADAAGRKGARGIASIGGGAYSASGAVASAAQTIATNVDQLARKLGAQGITFTPARTPAARATQNNVFGSPGSADYGGLARGGHVVGGDRRARGHDDRILLGPDGRPEARVGAGELLVFNGDQQAELEASLMATHGVGLDGFFAGPWRPHPHTSRHATGGRIPNMSLAGPDGAYRRAGNAALAKLDRAAERKAGTFQPPAGAGGALGSGGPHGLGSFDGIPVANWIIPELNWARRHGWRGSITSGYRPPGEVVHNAQGLVAPQGQSNHNRTDYPGGAIDVGDPAARAAGAALAGVLAGYNGARRLVWGGPVIGDWGHFSATGHALGGILPGLAKGGIFGKAKGLSHRAGSAAHAGAGGLSGWERQIADMERSYGQKDRIYGLSEEDFVVEDEFGSHVDNAAVKERTDEVGSLVTLRTKIREKILAYRRAVTRSIGHYEDAVKRIRRALAAIPKTHGKTKAAKRSRATAAKLRTGYKDRLDTYQSRLGDLRGTRDDLGGDAEDSRIDLMELRKELKGLDPKALLPGSTEGADGVYSLANDTGSTDTSSADTTTTDPGTDTSPVDAGTTAAAPPSLEDIATAAMAQFNSFKEGAQAAFAEFGSNAVRAGANPFATEAGAIAGLRNYGASQDTAPQVTQEIAVTIADPADTHVFTKSALHELQAAL